MLTSYTSTHAHWGWTYVRTIIYIDTAAAVRPLVELTQARPNYVIMLLQVSTATRSSLPFVTQMIGRKNNDVH